MKKLEELMGDNALHAVPQEQTVSGWRIAMIITGVAIGLPLMLTGTRLAREMSGLSAFGAFALGGLILAILGSFTGYVGAREKVSTYVIIQNTFGSSGAVIINSILTFAIFAWFAITAAVFGRALEGALQEMFQLNIPTIILTVFGVILMILTSIFGFKALDKLALAAVPVLLVFLGYMAVAGVQTGNITNISDHVPGNISFGQGVSMIVGSFIVGIVIFPDFCRYAARGIDGIIASVASMGFGLPLVLAFSAIPSLATGQTDIVTLLFVLGAGGPVLFLLVFATWTTNASNLYSGSLALTVLMPDIPRWKLAISGGAFGAIMAISGIADKLTDFLLILGAMIPPIASIYIIDHLILKAGVQSAKARMSPPKYRWSAFISWLAGGLFALMSSMRIVTLTSFPAIDSIILSLGCFYFLERWTFHTVREL